MRALILGSGFAGQEHAAALRRCGVELVGMASRTESVVKEVAAKMDIPFATTDWRSAIKDLKPDIVAVGTPGGVHLDMCVAAAEAGSHIYCDKPLATTAADAKVIWEAARDANVKTAYASTMRYNPAVLHAKELVASGAIGEVSEVECVSHYNWPKLMPYGWSHSLSMGGGRLNNNFTHKLGIVLNVVGGQVLAAMGETRSDLKKAPVGPPVHDFRNLQASALTPEEAEKAEWKDVDSDWAYTVLAKIGAVGSDPAEGISATFRHSGMRPGVTPDYVAFYGSKGSIHIQGAYARGKLFFRTIEGGETSNPASSSIDIAPGGPVEELETPAHIAQSLPDLENDAQRNWTILARELVDDIQGKGDAGYLTFRDGWLYQEVIDIARKSNGWTVLPEGS
ncbi:MAG: Gfo/Idh/MocA family oxidoreductase [Dehalococcoidia bacterium]